MAQGQQATTPMQPTMGGCPNMGNMMGQGMQGMGSGMMGSGMMGSGTTQGSTPTGMRALFGSRVTPMMAYQSKMCAAISVCN